MEVQTIKTNQGKVKIVVNDFLYIKNKNLTTSIRWECVRRRRDNCKATVKTDMNNQNPEIIGDHSHAPSATEVAVTKCRQTMKERARNTREKPHQILAAEIEQLDHDTRANIGNMATIQRDIQRHQRSQQPAEPAALADLVIADNWKVTKDGRPFLIHDSGEGVVNRIVVYATEESLRLLAVARTWFIDGNFSMAPLIFKQLYIIRAPLGNIAITCVYSFLPGKSELIYRELFQAIVDTCERLGFNVNPTHIISDFEISAIKATQHILGQHVVNKGCFYHLTQSTWRKIQSLGLTQLYKDREDIRQFCGMIDGLAFLPINDIQAGLQYLQTLVDDELEPLLQYFDTNYVSGQYRRIQPPALQRNNVLPPVVLRHVPPQFPPVMWNVREITLNNDHRTNNFCEAWNNGYFQLVGHKHPSFWSSIEAIRKDEATSHVAILQDAIGNPPAKRIKRKSKDLQRRLRNLCLDHSQGRKNLQEFLTAIGHTIRLL